MSLQNVDSNQADSCDVLIVEDDPPIRRALRRSLAGWGYNVRSAATRGAAEEDLQHHSADVVLLDLNLPDGRGLDLLGQLRQKLHPPGVVVLTGSSAGEDMREALRIGATSFLRKPADELTLEAQVRLAFSQSQSWRGLSAAPPASSDATIRASETAPVSSSRVPVDLAERLSRLWDLRHVETGAHVRRIGAYTERLASHLGMGTTQANELGRLAMLHDVGKLSIPDAILCKAGPLSGDEFALIKRHTELGEKFLRSFQHPFLDRAAVIARSHHERWDGSGYPDGLRGEECPWEVQIVAIVDVYDALGQARCYKPAWSREQLHDFFRTQRGVQFSASLVDALFSLEKDFEQLRAQHPDESG